MKLVFLLIWLAGLSSGGQKPLTAEMESRAHTFLKKYDQAWEAGKLANLLELFLADSQAAEKLQSRAGFLDTYAVETCRSRFLTGAQSAGNLGIYILSRISVRRRDGKEDWTREFNIANFFLLSGSTEHRQAFLAEEFDPALQPYLDRHELKCKACNYGLGRPEGWFVIPRKRGWSPCTASLSMVHPTGEITADFMVLESTHNVDPKEWIDIDDKHLTRTLGASTASINRLKTKPLDIGKHHQGMQSEGAIEWEANGRKKITQIWRTYVSQGPILYTLNVYGDDAAFRKYRAEIDWLKMSFKILNPALPVDALRGTMKAAHNPGGRLEGTNYSNQECGVRLQGPGGWKAREFSGPTLFHVRYSHPRNAKIVLDFHAMERPAGSEEEEIIARILARKPGSDSPLRRTRIQHAGLQSTCYLVEGPRAEGEEITAYLPTGTILFVLEFRAPAGSFEEEKEAFQRALDSLSRF